MNTIIQQARDCLEQGYYYPALITCLTLPDICGAIDGDDGKASRKKYESWYDDYVPTSLKEANEIAFGIEYPLETPKGCSRLTGKESYIFRCSLLHEGKTVHEKSSFERILFIDPSSGISVGHDNLINNVLHIDLNVFCYSVIIGVEKWLNKVQGTEGFKRNYNNFVRLYENGYSNIIRGVPVIT